MKAFMRFHSDCLQHVCGVFQMLDDVFIKPKRELTLVPEDLVSAIIKYGLLLLVVVLVAVVTARLIFGDTRILDLLLMVEYLKHCRHLGVDTAMFFWRDHIGNEVDLLLERGDGMWPVEMKSGATFQREWLTGLHTWRRHTALAASGQPLLISAAPGFGEVDGVALAPWQEALAGLAGAGA
jgi:hypothetical protein